MPEQPLTQNAVYSAIPTVHIDGQANDKVTAQLLSIEMREEEGGMSALEMRVSNFGSFSSGLADLVFEDGLILKLGAAVVVYAGDASSPTEIFRGKITGLEGCFPQSGPPDLVVLAEDSLQSARMARRTKTWDSTSLTQIAQQVANNLGLTPVMSDLDSNIGTQLQFNESDLHFLRRLLVRYDADMQVVGSELHASPRSQAQRNSIEIDLNSQLKEVRVIADLSHQVTQITATGWDYKQGQRINVTSQATSLGPGSGKAGKDWLLQAMTSRSEHLGQFANLNAQEAQSLADAEFTQRMRTFVVAHGISEGNPNLRVGTYLKLNGLGPRFSNTYYTTSTLHHFDTQNGYETRFCAECAYLGGAS
ncbi:MAG TPA: contractile injection system protein, VgrG/Pvc8 family [Terracidiphilus sp.]